MTSTQAADPDPHQLARLVDAIDLPIGRWNRANRLVYCNEPYLDWAERRRDELIGKTLAEIYGDEAWQSAEPAFREAFAGRKVAYERLLTHGSKASRWSRVQVFPDADAQGVVDTVFTVAFDIHDDVVAREELEAGQHRLDRFTENIPYPLTYVDRGFVLRFDNKAYCEVVNQTPEQLLGHREGDRLLVSVGVALQGAVRAEDAVGRFGGDEFLVLARMRDIAGAHTLALHMLQAVRELTLPPSTTPLLSASIGYALAPAD